MSIPIICFACGASGSVNRVTAGLQCRCGSTDIDINDLEPKQSSSGPFPETLTPEDEQFWDGMEHGKRGHAPQRDNAHYMRGHSAGTKYRAERDVREGSARTAAPHGPGTGWNESRPNRLQGWDEYQGPSVGPNPLAEQHMTNNNNGICPACGGSGRDSRASGGGYDENTCRLCGGSGRYNAPTSKPSDYLHPESFDAHQGPSSGGARWQGGATATRRSADPLGSAEDYISNSTPGYRGRDESEKHWETSPFVRSRPDHDYSHGNKPLQLDQAACPNCRHTPTQIVKDRNDDAIWHCPSGKKGCGPLANIDKHPEVNPYDPPVGFKADTSIKLKGKLFTSSKKTGKLLPMVAAILDKNSGLTPLQSFDLARRALDVQKKAEETN